MSSFSHMTNIEEAGFLVLGHLATVLSETLDLSAPLLVVFTPMLVVSCQLTFSRQEQGEKDSAIPIFYL